MAAADAPTIASDVPEPELAFRAGGRSVTARILGRSETGRAPVMLLGFRSEAPDDADEREALVVGRDLASLSDAQLAAALDRARPPSRSMEPRPFFADSSERRRR